MAATVTVAEIPTVTRTVSPEISGDEQVISSNSSPMAVPTSALQRTTSCTTTPEHLEENERLRKENMQLIHEVTQLKGLCNNILNLMTSYASNQLDSEPAGREEKPLELLPARQVPIEEFVSGDGAQGGSTEAEEEDEEETTPKLFGVSIGAKRLRRDGEEEEEEEEENNGPKHLQLQEREIGHEVKSEPLDGISNRAEDRRWLELGKDGP